jgi:hypothetical protein
LQSRKSERVGNWSPQSLLRAFLPSFKDLPVGPTSPMFPLPPIRAISKTKPSVTKDFWGTQMPYFYVINFYVA